MVLQAIIFWYVELPEDGVKPQTSSSDARLYLYIQKAHWSVSSMNRLMGNKMQGLNNVKRIMPK